tara:strand:- start:685 stop:1785 length:1101 start_codon:yes stop_codon:yes gene_type:complete
LFKGAEIKKTALYTSHLNLTAKMVPFAGYEMPITYKAIKEEYKAVRENCGVFDVSHMAQIQIKGRDAIKFIQKITVNDINKITDYEAQYSAMCNLDGGLIDDLIIFRFSEINFIIIANSSNTDKVLKWMYLYSEDYNINIQTMNSTHSLIALQGPKSRDILNQISNQPINIPFYHLMDIKLMNQSVILSRTGYTGELGFEIFASHQIIKKLWQYFINKEVCPAGLAVRDILRMEMKYCLYGNDITESTNPLEAGLSWIVNFEKGDFFGRDSLVNIKLQSCSRKLIGFIMSEKAIPRKGYKIYCDQKNIGEVTSGTHSPKLSKGIGLAYVDSAFSKINNTISIEIRNKLVEAQIVKTPFINDTSLYN